MAEAVDYFSNHSLKLRFPWRLYHAPIVEALENAIRQAPGPNVLNVGSGPFFELEHLPRTSQRYTVCDIDARAIDLARKLHPSTLAGADVIELGKQLPYPDGQFDLVVSMDVIEHLPDPLPWAREVVRVVRPGGHLFLTTPNYGSTSLKVIEGTALEVIARIQGFSRRNLHPSRFDRALLEGTLGAAGATQIAVEEIAFGWVLAANARRTPTSAH